MRRLLSKARQWRASWRPAWAMMPQPNATLLLETVLRVASLLEREQVKYTVHFGCLLGAARLQGLLPWDIDVDLFLLDEDAESAARKLTGVLREHGWLLRFSAEAHYFTIRPFVRWGGRDVPLIPMVEVGLLTASPDPDGKGIFYDRHSPVRTFAPGELLPLKRYPWYGSYLWGPQQADPVLGRLYQEASAPEVMRPYRRPPVAAESDRFWTRARPLDGSPDWEAISRRCRQPMGWRCLAALPWYCANGAYSIAVEWLRRRAGGHPL